MITKLTESTIETFAIKLFERLGYDYIHAPDIAPDGDRPERSRYDEVLLSGRLEAALKRINPKLQPALLHAALKEVQRIHSPELLANNEAFHRRCAGIRPQGWRRARRTGVADRLCQSREQ